MIKDKERVQQRMQKHIKVNEDSGCWEWFGSKRTGYGRMIVGSRRDGTRRTMSAHRVSYELANGEIPGGMEICHKCDNPCCVNPDHLFAGTRQDNVDDRERKGRNVILYGEDRPNAKLTREIVLAARKDRALRGTPFRTLANRYGVTKKTMQQAIKGETWKAVPLETSLMEVPPCK